jgi:DNA modification methylase
MIKYSIIGRHKLYCGDYDDFIQLVADEAEASLDLYLEAIQ